MSNERSPTQYKGVRAIAPPDLTLAKIAPPGGYRPTVKGQLYLDTVADSAYMWSGTVWIALGSGATGGVVTLTGDSGGAISPVGGNIDILGTLNQLVTTGTAGTITLSLPSAIVAPGSLTTTTTLAAGTTITAGTGITSTLGNIVASAGDITATLGSVSAGTSVTAGTTVTATLGNITATNGNIVRGTAGNKDVYTSVATTIAAGANSAGTVTLVAGEAVVSTTAVTANSQIRIYRQGVGATGAAATGNLSILTRTAGTSFTIRAVQPADATAAQASDVSVIGWEIVN